MEKIFTPSQLAKRWGCSTQTVRDAIVAGHLPHFRVGRLMRVPGAAVSNYERQI
nr:excisionase family DNA-binding protein [uncultured Shimia sp.]